jgi:glucodextranase-like protein
MIHTTRKLFAALVVSLFVVVISLPGIISAAYAPPVIATQKPVTEGMVAPVRIAMDKYGNYYMTDPLSRGVLKYNLYGKLIKKINVPGVPLGIAVASNDNIIVTQGKYASILDPNGVEIVKLGSGVGQFIKANGVTVDKYDKIYVTDGLGNNVQVFNLLGALVGSFGGFGTGNGLFHNPSAIAYEKALDQVAVADTLNGRIQFFNATDYSYVKTIGTLTRPPSGFISPEGIAFEYTADATPLLKRMYVVDTWDSTVQVYDPSTPIYLSAIGSFGNAVGQLQTPSDLVFDSINSTGRLLVVNGAGNLQIYGVDGGLSPSDAIPPQLTIGTVQNNTSDANLLQTPPLGGTVEAGAVVTVTVNTAASVGAVTVSSPTWSCPITGLVPGSNTITVTATDAAMNTSSKTITVVYTPAAPSLTITTATNTFTKLITGYTITGTVDAGSTVAVTNTTTGGSGNATVTGTDWSYLATQLQEGPNSLTVTATKASSAANTKSVVVIRDTVTPNLIVSAIADGSYSASSTQNIAGRVVDDYPGTVSMTVNGGAATTVATSDFSFPATLQPGANTVVVQATDLAGNVSFSNTRTINYDPAKPLITISTPADNSYTNTSAATISGSVSNPATATVTVGGVPVTVTAGAWGPAPVTLVNGLNTISVVATSGANSAQEKRTVTFDPSAPALAITSPAQDITAGINVANITISGTVTDAGSPITLTAKVNNVAVVPAPTVIFGTFQFNANLVEGPNVVEVTATDSAGNAPPPAIRNILKDSTPPTPFTIDAAPSGNPKTISGTKEAGATVAVADAGYAFPVTYPTATTWAADLSGHSYDRATIKSTATDAAGNTSALTGLVYTPPTGNIHITVDIYEPVDITDAQDALKCVVRTIIPDAGQISRADIGPLLKGKANPNGRIDITDAILILRKALDPAGTYW